MVMWYKRAQRRAKIPEGFVERYALGPKMNGVEFARFLMKLVADCAASSSVCMMATEDVATHDPETIVAMAWSMRRAELLLRKLAA